MAVERIKEFTIDLGDLIKTRVENFVNSRKRILTDREAEFQKQIQEEGMTYEAQLNYRNKQLEDEEKKKYPDINFMKELKAEVSYLKKMRRYEKVRNLYLESYTKYKEGKIAINSLIDVVNSQLAVESDPTLRNEILANLSSMRIEKARGDAQILNDRVTLAQKDKSVDLTDKIITEVSKRRSKAVAVGDKETIAALDVKLAILKAQKQSLLVDDDLRNADLKVMREGMTASQKLTLLDDIVSKADKNTPITVGNQIWPSASDYWTAQKDAYIAGSGSGEFVDFFGEFSEEVTNKVDRLAALNQFGSIPLSAIVSIDQDYKVLGVRADFVPYVDKLENYRVSNLSFAVGKTAEAIIAETLLTGSFDIGTEAIKSLQAKTGIDTSAYLTDLWLKTLSFEVTTGQQAQALAEFRADFKGTTPEEELAKIPLIPIEPKVTQPTVPTGEDEKTTMTQILTEVRAQKAEYSAGTKPEGYRETLIKDLTAQFGGTYQQFISDTIYRELRAQVEPAYVPPEREIFQPPTPIPKVAQPAVPTPAPEPKPAATILPPSNQTPLSSVSTVLNAIVLALVSSAIPRQ